MQIDEQTFRPILQAAFEQGGLDGICTLVVKLFNEQETRHRAEIADLEARHQAVVAKLEARIAELEKRLGKNSFNSSKPPSSDGLKRRTRSLRRNITGRKPGGQPGHAGQRLHPSAAPDGIVEHPLEQCPQCGTDLSNEPVVAEEARQVFEVPPIALQVTEHRAQRKRCPQCGRLFTGAFPEGVRAPTQYGPGMQSVMSYLQAGQLLPCERTAQVCEDLFGHRPSAGSVVSAVAQCAQNVEPATVHIREQLTQAQVLHADETGVRCKGKTHWLHVAGSTEYTLYSHSEKRGKEGLSAGGVLSGYSGILVHDFWGPYDNLKHCEHARCNAHLLRELKACEEDGHAWASGIVSALIEMKKVSDEVRGRDPQETSQAERQRLKEMEGSYDKWIKVGLKANPEAQQRRGRRGRIKQSAEHNLLKRLRENKSEVLRFAHDVRVPFDNNLAERDLRMIKVQQKISGCFRSEAGAKNFCETRSYLSTARKQGKNLFQAIKSAFTGQPLCFVAGAE